MTARGRGGRRAAGARGFTLIELTVAMLAGLIVAMGVVGLSRDATHTFHEEMRGAAAEATLRTAVDRLRADLQRAGYMSTGNIMADPLIAKPPGGAGVGNLVGTAAGLKQLASIYRVPNGSYSTNLAGAAVDLSANNGVKPDLIQIGGNMTSSDQYAVQLISQGTNGSGNCTRIFLSQTSPAMYRILASGSNATQALHDVFQPVPTTDTTDQFIVRLVDDTGHTQYLVTCAEGDATGFDTTTSLPYIEIDTGTTSIVTASAARTNGGVSGFAAGVAWINPVDVVKWEITTAAGTPGDPEPAQDQALAGTPLAPTTPDPAKFDLMRSYVNAAGAVVAASSEIVAEYAVDLDFAFSVDTSTSSQSPSVVTYGFEDSADNDGWAYPDVFTQNAAGTTIGPQRIRAVRARVVTRTAQADRAVNVPVTNYGTQTFMYRYQIDATDYARARTLVTTVSLPNQARNFY